MFDPRLQKLAQIITRYSLDLKPRDIVRIKGSTIALPLLHEIYREALRTGAFVVPRLSDPSFDEILFKEGTDDQLQFVPILLRQEIEYFTKYLDLYSDTNTKQFNHVNPDRMNINNSASEEEQRLFNQYSANGKIQWCNVLYPTEGYAQDAGMSLWDFEEFVFGACLVDQPDPVAAWKQVYTDQQCITNFLNGRRHIRIVAEGTDLSYRCNGRTWINCAGKQNLPDGEVYTAPIGDSVNGHITISYPSIYNGTLVEGIQLTLKDGRIVKATADRGEDFLNSMLNMDPGAQYIGECAFGLNYGIKQATGHTLFDEKIGGTMHLAPGWAYPESGGTNESNLHWDLVCDLREGEVYADEELCYEKGQFLIS
jgi:aminopeptidase